MTGTTGLVIDGLEVRVGELHLRVSLTVGEGETVAVVGPNGAGKTTLLRALAGLQPIAAGSVRAAGRVLDDVAAGVRVPIEERGVGFVFQDHVLFPHLSALDNVAFGLRCAGMGKKQAADRAQAWLERMGLTDVAGLAPSQLSGGQAQRVALARALAGDPAVVLLDEPLSALDASAKPVTRRHLVRHLGEHSGVRLLVTHDPVDAAAVADRIVVLEAGRVVQSGTLDELAERPASRYVADLVGVNLLRGRAHDGRVDLGAIELVTAEPATGDVHVVIPPRAVTLSLKRPEGSARNVWPVTVRHLERAGDRVRVRLEVAAAGPISSIVAEVTAGAVADLALGEGTELWAAVKATEVVIVPA